ncbi:MAG: ComF family protein [Nitrospirae bacterium]|nr:ComF family protein [Nitrospirota bacterium]
MRELQKWLKDKLAPAIVNLIYPSKCPVCGKDSNRFLHSPICIDCWNGMSSYEGNSCRSCATPLPAPQAGSCGECLKERPVFSKVISFGIYKGTLKEAIGLFKFSGIRRLSKPLGGLLSGLNIPKADCIIPVPLEIHGLKERGFNQSLLIAKELSQALKIPLFQDVLYKKRRTLPQIGLSASERAVNLKDAFGVKRRLDDKEVLLVDDVMTTGATVKECSKELIKAGGSRVTVVVLARAEM